MVKSYGLILLAIISTSGQLLAQENWGPPETMCEIAGCTWSTSNPCFDHSGMLVLEFGHGSNESDHKLYFFSDSLQLLPGDSINLDSVSNHSPFITYDGEYLYFSSNRPGGYGGYDIWVSSKQGDTWGPPRNLGPEINSSTNEFGPSLPLDGGELYFCRALRNDPWSSESVIFRSTKMGGIWAEPERLPEPINSGEGDFEPAISSDGNKLYFTSFRANGFQATWAYVSYRQQNGWSTPTPLNSNINHFMYCDYDSAMRCDVFSVGIDSSGLAMYNTYYFLCDFIWGFIQLSRQTIGIDQPQQLPQTFGIKAYPNPFNIQTTFEIDSPEAGQAKLLIYDISGRLVAHIIDENIATGKHSVKWNADKLSSGIYFYSFQLNNKTQIGKVTLLK
jgi:hypothetical protein